MCLLKSSFTLCFVTVSVTGSDTITCAQGTFKIQIVHLKNDEAVTFASLINEIKMM